MAYEKFIKKDGKLYGPYLYESKRVDGRVISEYKGPRNIDYKKYLLITLGILLLGVFLYFFAFSGKTSTGNAVLDLNANYQPNKPLEGQIKLSLQEGELIPASSKLVLENDGKVFEFNLKDVVSDETNAGEFYVNGNNISGSGEGYGIPGQKEIFPSVYFTLSILSQQNSEIDTSSTSEIPTEITSQSTIEETTTTETQTQTATEVVNPENIGTQTETMTTPQTTTAEGENSAPITGNAVLGFFGKVSNFFLGLTPTGYAIASFEKEVQGQVSKDRVFTYSLNDGDSIELVPRSVKTDSKQLDDDAVQLKTEGNQVSVTTSYSEIESGYGEDYLGSDQKDLMIDISNLNLVLKEGDLKLSLINQDQELMSVTTTIKGEGEVNAEEIVNKSETIVPEIQIQNVSPINVTNNTQVVIPLELTSEEKAALTKEFGNFSIDVKEAVLKNGFITIRYELGDYWVENSYSADLNNETLNSFMDKDKTKWLKDIARSLSSEKESEKNVENLIENLSN